VQDGRDCGIIPGVRNTNGTAHEGVNPMAKRAVVVTLLLAAGIAGCGGNRAKPDGSGTIECTEVQVAPKVAGVITELAAAEGGIVASGDVVAVIDSTDYALRRDEARAAFEGAESQLDLALAGPRDEDIETAREGVDAADAASKAAEADRQRVQSLFDSGSATQKQLDDVTALADRAQASLGAAQQLLQKLVRGSREQELRAARAFADQARARLAQARKAVGYCTVTAPVAGTVTVRSREQGEFVAVGAPIVTIARLDSVWLSIYVPEDRLASVKLGQAARVRVDGNDNDYHGTVTFVSPEAEFTPRNVQTPAERAKLVYRVKITLENPDGVFKPGLPADAYLE
jgi:HlyD family secretion protein